MVQIDMAVFIAILAIIITILGGLFTLAVGWGGQKEKQKTDRDMILENRQSIRTLCDENSREHSQIYVILDDVRKSVNNIEGKMNGRSSH